MSVYGQNKFYFYIFCSIFSYSLADTEDKFKNDPYKIEIQNTKQKCKKNNFKYLFLKAMD